MESTKQLQSMIDSINHNIPVLQKNNDESHVERIKKSIARHEIDKFAIENGFFYCNESEKKVFFEELLGSIYNEISQRYVFSLKNKKTIFKKLVAQSIIEELDFFIKDKRQIFIDMDKLFSLMKVNGFEIREYKYIKYRDRNSIVEFEYVRDRHTYASTVQRFKKWLSKYLPCSIDCVTVKKEKDKYIVSCSYLVSIPIKPHSIKKLDIELRNIDTDFHKWDRIYDITNFKEKKLRNINYELNILKKALEKKENDNK